MKIITGNPGTGKHTIAELISKRLKLEMVDINKVALDEKIFKKTNETLDVDVKKLKKIINKKSIENSILVGHLAPYVVSAKNVDSVIVLRKSPYKLLSVYKKRKYTNKKSLENLGSEILGITHYDAIHEFGREKIYQIDTSNKSICSTVKKVESIFKGIKVKSENVDWLQLILKKGDMKKFFPY